MAIKREDFDVGGTVLVVTRTGNGAAVMFRRRKAKVTDVNRAACVLEWLDDPKKPVTIPFKQLEPDPDWLDARDKKREARAKLLEDEKRAAPTLTYSLAEKLAQEDEPDAKGAGEQERQLALSQIAALRTRDSEPPPPTPPPAPTPPPEPASKPTLVAPSEAAPTGWTGDVETLREAVQVEIDRLEEEQRALLEMLVPIEQKLSALKRRRKAMRDFGTTPRLKWPASAARRTGTSP